MRRLTPAPGRGAVLAAGAVVLVTFALLFDARMAGRWAAGPRFVLFAVLALLIGAIAAQAPRVGETPLPYHATLQVATVVLGGLALLNLADTLGANGQLGGAGELGWTSLLLGAATLLWAKATNAAILTLLGAALEVIALVSLVRWVFDTHSATPLQWTLLVAALGLTLGAVWLRDRARRHAVALVDVAGLAIIAIGALSYVGETVIARFTAIGATGYAPVAAPHPVGWELVLLVFGFALIAYGAADRERVPPFLGVVALVLFVGLSGIGRDAFLGWPLVLGLLALVLLAIGLRPRQELPPEPPVPGSGPPAPAPPPPDPPTTATEIATP